MLAASRSALLLPQRGQKIMQRTGCSKPIKAFRAVNRRLHGKAESSKPAPVFTHLSSKSHRPEMVDVGVKPEITRIASAEAIVKITEQLKTLLEDSNFTSPKGPVFSTAVLAGTMAAKKTSDLIPLCHPLRLASCTIDVSVHGVDDLKLNPNHPVEVDSVAPYVKIRATVSARERTGVEMEALTAASVAALTIIDMCKSVVSSTQLDILSVRVMEKHKIGNDPDAKPTSQRNSLGIW